MKMTTNDYDPSLVKYTPNLWNSRPTSLQACYKLAGNVLRGECGPRGDNRLCVCGVTGLQEPQTSVSFHRMKEAKLTFFF